jgi:hypothetical protein
MVMAYKLDKPPRDENTQLADYAPDQEFWPFAQLGAAQIGQAERQIAFLMAFEEHGTILHACRAIGIARRTVELWRDHDALGFNARFELAHQQRRDVLEQMVYRRLEDPQGNRGSDILLMFANKGLNPAKWATMAPASDSGSKELLREVLDMKKREMKQVEDKG